jgi:hypothetical protein
MAGEGATDFEIVLPGVKWPQAAVRRTLAAAAAGRPSPPQAVPLRIRLIAPLPNEPLRG